MLLYWRVDKWCVAILGVGKGVLLYWGWVGVCCYIGGG